MRPTYSLNVACVKEKAQFSAKQTKKHVKTRSRGESQQILVTFLDAFLFGVTLHFVLMHIQLIPLILFRLTIQRSLTLETFNCKHVCEDGNISSVYT